MQHAKWTGLLLAAGLLGSVQVLTGCSSFWGCDAAAACEPEDEDGEESYFCPEDPAAGPPHGICGVWVSASSGDDLNPGTPERPVKTLAKGIDLALSGPGRVYACGEAYPEAVILPDGVDLFGGFDCADLAAWKYIGSSLSAEILAPVALAALVLPGSEHESLVGDVHVVAADAVEPGASSIAVLAFPGARGRFRRSKVTAGRGADGADGADGSADGQPASKGLPGNNGADACTMDTGFGGTAVTTHCDGVDSSSGEGGDANALAANDGLVGSPAPDPNAEGYGAGGTGENPAKGAGCTGGTHGAAGQDGENGPGARADGRLTIDGYLGVAGADGLSGLPGQGGGGGGASLGVCAMEPKGGAGGGSGGSGGCGGKPGTGGQAGGSSIAFVVLSGGLIVENATVTAKDGGRGGNGGFGQAGGQGGLPGYGGLSAPGGSQGGCAGGVGGLGGYGGYGGGGRGGHSIAFANIPGANFTQGTAKMWLGAAGRGGSGGIPGTSASDGYDGISAESHSFDP